MISSTAGEGTSEVRRRREVDLEQTKKGKLLGRCHAEEETGGVSKTHLSF